MKIVVFTEEEGSRFGVACLGSRLLTGAIDARTRRSRSTDRDGVTLADAMDAGGTRDRRRRPPIRTASPASAPSSSCTSSRAGALRRQPVGIASAIWPHGRWRFDFTGEGNHAGTTRMDDRHDPMLTFAYTVLAANKEARLAGAHATIGPGRRSTPNATNAIPPTVTAWLDARAADEPTLDEAGRRRSSAKAGRAGRPGRHQRSP